MKDAIQVRGLKKSYGNKMVLRSLDFQIEKGEIFALLGVNGAGKTATLECIEGLRKYDDGKIIVNGKMGIQLQSSSLPSHIKPMEAVKLFAKWNNTEIDHDMLNALGIREIEKSQYIQLSTGQKRRLQSRDEVVNGIIIKHTSAILTWDWVTEPGINSANTFDMLNEKNINTESISNILTLDIKESDIASMLDNTLPGINQESGIEDLRVLMDTMKTQFQSKPLNRVLKW